MRNILLLAVAACLAACASQDTSGLVSAATTPLTDLNLVNAPIPEVLLASQRAPYAGPPDTACTALVVEIRALDEVLGPDLDTPVTESNPGLIERGSALVVEQATRYLRREAESVVPFRSWVRKLSGAERYSRQVAAAIASGTVRRAFLKGLAVAQRCGRPEGTT